MPSVLISLMVLGGCAHAGDLWTLYRAQNFFRLQTDLPPPRLNDGADTLFLRAATLAAFRRTEQSERILSQLLARPLSGRGLERQARQLLMLDLRSRFQYAPALRAVSPLLAGPPERDDANLRELRNRAALLKAVGDVPAQSVRRGSGDPLAMDADGRVRVFLGRAAARMAFDTGANFSVITRSAAKGLGLRVRPAEYSVSSPLGGRVKAHIAASDFSFADGTHVSNALFLVLPDRSLVLADGRPFDGLIGLPVLAELGRIRFRPGRATLATGEVAGGKAVPLALGQNDPLLRVSYRGQELLCRLDTGAERSIFYEPFHRLLDSAPSRRRSVRIGGAAGTHSFDAREPGSLAISIAGQSVVLDRAVVLTSPIQATANAGLACAIGRDALERFAEYTIDLRALTLTLGPPATSLPRAPHRRGLADE